MLHGLHGLHGLRGLHDIRGMFFLQNGWDSAAGEKI
jgi:hypothetical protein